MGFFSELKSDLSQAAKSIIPEEADEAKIPGNETAEETPVKAKSEAEVKKDLNEMLDHLDEIKLDEAEPVKEEEPEEEKVEEVEEKEDEPEEIEAEVEEEEPEIEESVIEEPVIEEPIAEVIEPEVSDEEVPTEDSVADLTSSLTSNANTFVEERVEKEDAYAPVNNYNNGGFETMDIQQQTPTDETASITEGMKINGNLETTGSLDLIGKITGNVTCLGKLNVTGEIEGDSRAAEIYAEAARITGEVRSNGSVKIGQSTVVIGNIYATSAVIAGAVKGDIDVPGPVVLDTTAIVMGNIKSQSVQINNGAVIEGNCSQSYAEVNPSAFFDGLKGTK